MSKIQFEERKCSFLIFSPKISYTILVKICVWRYYNINRRQNRALFLLHDHRLTRILKPIMSGAYNRAASNSTWSWLRCHPSNTKHMAFFLDWTQLTCHTHSRKLPLAHGSETGSFGLKSSLISQTEGTSTLEAAGYLLILSSCI